MGNILTTKVTIKGVRPLLWHRFGPDALPLEKQERTGVAGNDPEEWKKTVLMTSDRQLYLDPTMVFGAVRDGSKYTKKGRGSIQSLVVATLQVTDDRVLIDRFVPEEDKLTQDSNEPVYLDVRGVRNPTTKARNIRYRVTASSGWQCQFSLLWDKTVVAREQMNAALIDAGRLVGIGSGRSIGMGRFEIVSFDVVDS